MNTRMRHAERSSQELSNLTCYTAKKVFRPIHWNVIFSWYIFYSLILTCVHDRLSVGQSGGWSFSRVATNSIQRELKKQPLFGWAHWFGIKVLHFVWGAKGGGMRSSFQLSGCFEQSRSWKKRLLCSICLQHCCIATSIDRNLKLAFAPFALLWFFHLSITVWFLLLSLFCFLNYCSTTHHIWLFDEMSERWVRDDHRFDSWKTISTL